MNLEVEIRRAALCESVTLPGEQWRDFLARLEDDESANVRMRQAALTRVIQRARNVRLRNLLSLYW